VNLSLLEGKAISKSNEKALVPALDARVPYFSRLSARSALYTDLRLLLDGLQTSLHATEYRRLVLEENRLARSSASSRKKLWKELRSRYILDRDHPLYAAFWSEWIRCQSEPERGFTAYVLLALNDRLVADLGTEWLFSRLRRGPSEIRPEEVHCFIQLSKKSHSEVWNWSEETLKRVVRHYMASIRDFGLTKGTNKKVTVAPALYAAPIRLLIRALRISGKRPTALIHDSIFRLVAIDRSEVVDALGELNRRGELRFKMQADVVELEVEMDK
jgi:hypothetical protein